MPVLLPTDELRIGQLAERCGVATSALRYYEERGLIRSLRTSSGHRRYQRATARRVAFIVFAQRIGLSLGEISVELDRLPGDRILTRTEWARLSGTWRRRIDSEIEKLSRLRDSLSECIGCGCLSLDRCKLSNSGDRVRKYGSGPRRWISDELS